MLSATNRKLTGHRFRSARSRRQIESKPAANNARQSQRCLALAAGGTDSRAKAECNMVQGRCGFLNFKRVASEWWLGGAWKYSRTVNECLTIQLCTIQRQMEKHRAAAKAI